MPETDRAEAVTASTNERREPLCVDARRLQLPETGICVRGKDVDGRWAPIDIAHLDRPSLFRFLRSRGGENLWAENTVAALLGHPPFCCEDDDGASAPASGEGE